MKITQLTSSEFASLLISSIMNGHALPIQVFIDKMIGEGKTDVLVMINKILSRPEILNRLISVVMKNDSLWKKALKNSYRHENGFHKIVLLSGKNFKLRIHHFGATAKIPMENIHDHRWPFASTILSGELKMDIFQRTDKETSTEELHHFIYKSDKTNGNYHTDYLGLSYLEKIQERVYYPGDSYLMRTDELHRIKNQDGDESITLILTGKPISKDCNLFARKPMKEEEKQLIHYSENELRKMLDEIKEKIYPQKN